MVWDAGPRSAREARCFSREQITACSVLQETVKMMKCKNYLEWNAGSTLSFYKWKKRSLESGRQILSCYSSLSAEKLICGIQLPGVLAGKGHFGTCILFTLNSNSVTEKLTKMLISSFFSTPPAPCHFQESSTALTYPRKSRGRQKVL